MSTKYLLIRRLPDGRVRSHMTAFDGFLRAARVAGQVLLDSSAVTTRRAAGLFAEALRKQPLGTIWPHPSGYNFRIIRADFTTDGVAITPGLRVVTNDKTWGTVEAAQFMTGLSLDPGGDFFDGFYLVEGPDKKFNGERLATKEPAR